MFKSCKLIPVMLVGVVFLGKKYSWLDYLAMLSLTIGMVIFSVGDSLVNTQFSTPGLVAIGFALMADALIGNVQEKSMNKYNASTTEMIFYSKGIGSVFLLIALVVTGELVPAFLYCWERPIVYLYFFVRDFPPLLAFLPLFASV
jgi:adenosine 3'-phospho 5'-phosphosulfate transporter B3